MRVPIVGGNSAFLNHVDENFKSIALGLCAGGIIFRLYNTVQR